MSISTSTIGNLLIIAIEGRCDFSTHKEFDKAAAKITDSISSIKVDFEKANYLDSSALGMLLVLKEKIGGRKQDISLVNTKHTVKRVLDTANFKKLFHIA